MSRPRYTVRIVRPDRSVTYRCSTTDRAHAEREAAAWEATGTYTAEVRPAGEPDERAWRAVTKSGATYRPDGGGPTPEPIPYPAGGIR